MYLYLAITTFAFSAFDSRLCSRQTCNRHAERRAGNVVHAGVEEELNGSRVAAVLATNAHFQILAGGSAAQNT